MIFLDINTFFSPKAGGIRTYHQAKIEWFKRHPEHRYYLVYPAAARKERQEAANVTLVEAAGPALTQDPSGYRLLIDFIRIFKLIRRVQPDVLEAGDPWLTGIFCLLIRKSGIYKGLLVSFYHSDPVPSYFEPWAARGPMQGLRRALIAVAAPVFYWLQSGYDLTVVASKTAEQRLRSKGVRALAHLPFGVPAFFFEDVPAVTAPRGPGDGDICILYAGRLDREKGIDLVLEALPKSLRQGNIRITVVGRGSQSQAFSSFKHARFQFHGYIDEPAKIRDLYDKHHILIAPGPYETFGLGVLEAMARGLVVVGPDRGGTAELLRQAQSPFLFKAGDALDFMRVLDKAIECDWASESARSRALASRYGAWDQAIGRMIKRYTARLGAGSL